jgi:DMSO/TMAO reductase YedYZ molybdopterin-dependent catalytic subunit
VVVFALSSLAIGFAPSDGFLVAFRAAQGVGAAFMMPATLSIITQAFPAEQRGTAIGTWAGVPVSVIAELVGPLPEARYLRFDSFDSGYSNGWDLASAMHPQTILAYGFNDRPLNRQHGAPLRLYSPIKLGYKLTKYVTTMSFTRDRHGGYWEDQGYPWHAGV